MDERERERYLAWRRAEGKDRRGRLYRRLRIASILAGLAVLVAGAALAIVERPRAAKQTVASLPAETLPAETVRSAPSASVTPDVPAAPRRSAAAAARSSTATELPPRMASRQPVEAPPAPRIADATIQPLPATDSPGASASSTQPPANAAPSPVTVIVEPTPAPTVVVAPPPAAPAITPEASSPTVVVSPPPGLVEPAPRAVEPAPAETRLEKLKHMAGYIPEVWLARNLGTWMKTQPPGELAPPPPERTLPQSR